jgi:hypothetical protein
VSRGTPIRSSGSGLGPVNADCDRPDAERPPTGVRDRSGDLIGRTPWLVVSHPNPIDIL